MVDPLHALLVAMRDSGAGIVIPNDGLTVRHLHALYATLPATEDGALAASLIQRSLGDPAAYLLIDSRHEVQTAARADGLDAAESFAIGRATDPEKIAQALPFPWVLKADYVAGGAGSKLVRDLAGARAFIRRAGAPPRLGLVLRQMVVDGDRAAMGEWLRAMRPGLSAQRPVAGAPASTVAACWEGQVLAFISVEAVGAEKQADPPAVVRIIDNKSMENTTRVMAEKLGLSGFQELEFTLSTETGEATLTEINPYSSPPAYLNAGPDQDLVGSFCLKWLGRPPAEQPSVHPERMIAYFPDSWAANPQDPVLATGAYDVPAQERALVGRMMQLARRNRRCSAVRSTLRSIFHIGSRG
jgi:hypothetical protein